MDLEREAAARELFFAYDGSEFYMSRDGRDAEFKSFLVPLETRRVGFAGDSGRSDHHHRRLAPGHPSDVPIPCRPGAIVGTVAPNSRSKLVTYQVTFEGSSRVERIRAEAYRTVPPYVEFVVTEGDGLDVRDRVIAKLDGREARITATG